VSLYKVATHERIGDSIPVGTDSAIDVSPAGTELAIAGPHGVVVWSLDRAVWLEAACRVADRNLTAAERRTYLAGLDSNGDTCQALG
jgi:hypothetical protein